MPVLALFLTTLAFAQEVPDGTSIVDLINQANQEVTRGNSAACTIQNTGRENELNTDCLELERKSYKDHLGRDLPISVVSDQRLHSLKSVYNYRMRVYDGEVCVPRAHVIGEMLAEKGIESVKLYLEPGSFWPFWQGYIVPDEKARARFDGSNTYYRPSWKHHVVNMIYVRGEDGVDREYIIDPFMEDMPVPREKWEARIRKDPSSSIAKELVMSRFNFGPNDYAEPKTEYDDRLGISHRVMNGEKGLLD